MDRDAWLSKALATRCRTMARLCARRVNRLRRRTLLRSEAADGFLNVVNIEERSKGGTRPNDGQQPEP
jgi:hypothetical protein